MSAEQIAKVLDLHRWKSMGISSVQCECGEVLYGDDSLTQFPADEAFRAHVAEAVLALLPEVTETVEWGVAARLPDGEHVPPRHGLTRRMAQESLDRLGEIWARGPLGDRPDDRWLERRTRTSYTDVVSEWIEVQP